MEVKIGDVFVGHAVGTRYTVERVQGNTAYFIGGAWDYLDSLKNPRAYTRLPAPTPPKAANPKTGAGAAKVPLQCNPPIASAWQSLAHEYGGAKYGARNWRDSEVPLMTYVGAIQRHVALILDGEDVDPITGIPHLACIMAGAAVALDAKAHGTLVDDRPAHGKAAEEFAKIQASLPGLREMWRKEREANSNGK